MRDLICNPILQEILRQRAIMVEIVRGEILAQLIATRGLATEKARQLGKAVTAGARREHDRAPAGKAGRFRLRSWQPPANPPYKLADRFAAHALTLCPRVYLLLRLAFLESRRCSELLESGRLARVLVFRERLSMMHRAGHRGRKVKNGALAFAWFVWDREHQGEPVIRRISLRARPAGGGKVL